MNENKCRYCEIGEPLIIGKTDDYGISIRFPNYLSAYGYNVHGSERNGLEVKIKFCPICGRELSVTQST